MTQSASILKWGDSLCVTSPSPLLSSLMVILQCKYVDKDGRLDVVEKEEFRSSPDQDVVSVCRIEIRL